MNTQDIIKCLETALHDSRHSDETKDGIKAAITKIKNAKTREQIIEVIKFIGTLIGFSLHLFKK